MTASQTVIEYALSRGLDAAALPFSALKIRLARLLPDFIVKSEGDTSGFSAVILAVPYRPNADDIPCEDPIVSLYSVPRDYHGFFGDFFAALSDIVPVRHAAFADHSPIDEVSAAVSAGMGVRGDNRLFISDRFGSFVFLGCVLLDEPFAGDVPTDADKRQCLRCGRCAAACPGGILRGESPCGGLPPLCLSELTQRKGELTSEQEQLIISNRCVWGCDVCQLVCPLNEGKEGSEVDFFLRERIPRPTSDMIERMPDDEFARRAYSWRKKKAILRNLSIYENQTYNNGEHK